VAGIGINVHTPAGGFPTFIQDRATSLEEEGVSTLSYTELADLIVGALERRTSEPSRLLDADTLREIGARDALAARRVLTEEYGPGTARGIEADGALLLERPDGSRVRVVAGSVRPETPQGGRSCNSS
jgi:biotin-(acetyl-CoA carboxylase) ligase